MDRARWLKSLSVTGPMLVTTGLWILAKSIVPGRTFADSTVPQLLSQIASLWAIQLFAISLVISARSRTVERFFGGLDKSYHTHILCAKAGFGLMLIHPVLLIPHYLWTDQEVAHLFLFSDFWPRNVGIVSYYGFILLVGLTLWRFLEYQRWLKTHAWIGIPFVLGAVHATAAHSDIRAFEPLRDWNMFWMGLGTFAWIYKAFLYRRFAQRFGYRVASLRPLGAGISELCLEPKRRRIHHEPGEFAFISVRGNPDVSPEHHPFSISSDPNRRTLRFSYREVGDYTRSLSRVRPGDHVEVYGPYGEFTSYQLEGYRRQVWVGGGIGITPFLSMLSHEVEGEDDKRVWLIYDVGTAENAVYDAEIRGYVERAPERIDYRLRNAGQEGFLTGPELLRPLGDPAGVAFLFCGPSAMMRALKRQLVEAGVRPADIFFEEFDFV